MKDVADRDHLNARWETMMARDRANKDVARLTAEIAAMRPVVDAAVEFHIALEDEDADCVDEDRALWAAVDSYRKATKAGA